MLGKFAKKVVGERPLARAATLKRERAASLKRVRPPYRGPAPLQATHDALALRLRPLETAEEMGIVFVDVVGFTAYTAQHGDPAAVALLRWLAERTETIAAANGGEIVKQLGDGFLLAFPQAQDAVAAAISLKDDVRETRMTKTRFEVTLRVTVHVGKPVIEGGDLLGHDVNVAAVLLAHCEPNEVVVSQEAKEKVDGTSDLRFVMKHPATIPGVREPTIVYRAERREAGTAGERRSSAETDSVLEKADGGGPARTLRGSALRIEAVLAGGTHVVFRPIRSEDKDLLLRGFERLSEQSRYRRFFRNMDGLTDEELRYLTEIDYHDHFAWVALVPNEAEEPGVAVGRWIRSTDDPEVAEAAVAVIDDYQNRGIGKALLALLVESARERGIHAFRASVLGENDQMLRLLKSVGVLPNHWERGVAEFIVPLPESAEELHESVMGSVLRAAASRSDEDQ
jgi:class 3 adenylate cyclase/GNAT superfamily N-acetyltransferase